MTADNCVDTNPSALRVDKAGPRVYAVRDASSFARLAIHIILNAIPILCANIKRDLLIAPGEEESAVGEDRVYQEDVCGKQLVSFGTGREVSIMMGYRIPSIVRWLVKGRDYLL